MAANLYTLAQGLHREPDREEVTVVCEEGRSWNGTSTNHKLCSLDRTAAISKIRFPSW